MAAKDTMQIFLNGEERPGFLLYGLFPADADPWPSALPAEALARRYDLDGDDWRVCLWTLPVTEWLTGAAWQSAISHLLTSICERGAKVAWLASEGAAYADPPWLFDPEEMSGGVYGYLTADGRYACPLDPGQPWAVVGDEEMGQLRGLAGSR
ncbi:hypothetical protein HJ590_15750 [Naumannella sp. ID2617S]|nr:hypothetical protein [Naumannella sp. ID2617S]